MIDLYQMSLTDTQSDIVNELGWDGAIKADRSIGWYLDRQDGKVESVKAAFDNGYYQQVAVIDTDDLDEAWVMSNSGRVIQTADRCASMSMGDILDLNGTLYVVAEFGFEVIK